MGRLDDQDCHWVNLCVATGHKDELYNLYYLQEFTESTKDVYAFTIEIAAKSPLKTNKQTSYLFFFKGYNGWWNKMK